MKKAEEIIMSCGDGSLTFALVHVVFVDVDAYVLGLLRLPSR